MLCFQSKLFKVNIINFNYDHIIFIYFDEKIPYNIGTYVYKKNSIKIIWIFSGVSKVLKIFLVMYKVKIWHIYFCAPLLEKSSSALKWLNYFRYGIKFNLINQSINQSINQVVFQKEIYYTSRLRSNCKK